MKVRLLLGLFTAVILSMVPPTFAQVSTGMPPFGSFSGGPDVTNLGNLNFQYSFPIVSKPGRQMPFDYVLRFDNSVWYPDPITHAWTPATNWGWHGPSDAVAGRVSLSNVRLRCIDQDTGFTVFYFEHIWGPFTDGFGVVHPVFVSETDDSICGPGSSSGPDTATDGSGYTLNVGGTVTARNGQRITPVTGVGFGSGTLADNNGNQITASNGVFTDTLGMNVLTATGGAPNPLVFTYLDSTNTARAVNVNYTTYTVKTNFLCSGITDYPATSVSLVSSIVYPDGKTFSFTYEPTPGFPGDVTGRLHSVTLPTGATITYNYMGGNNGVECSDGSTAGFDRVTSDGTVTYTRSGASPSWTTTVQDASTPTRNQTTINFQQVGAGYYETHRTMDQGASTVLRQIDTCYNATAPPSCNVTPALPFTNIRKYVTLDNGLRSLTNVNLNNFGLPTEEDQYDFATAGNPLLRQTLITYAINLGAIMDHPASIIVKDGAGNQVAATNFGYDQTTPAPTTGVPQHGGAITSRGNLTSVSRWLNTTGLNLTTIFAYDDTGNVLNVTDPGGHLTSLSYADNFSDSVNRNSLAYVTQVTLPDTTSPNLAHHVTHTQYEPNTGRPSKTTDQNGKDTTFTYDLMLRPLQTNFPDGGQTTFSYPSATQSVMQRKINAGSLSYSTTLLDSYGRVKRTAIQNGESSNPYDLTDVCYDSNGRVSFQSYAYQAAGYNGAMVCSGAGDSFTYDALGRPTQVTHSDGTHANATYTGRARQITDEGNGSFNVTRILQNNALGELTGVCEVSGTILLGSGGTPAGCSQDIAAIGFLTSYAYDTLGDLTSVTQGSVTARTFAYDSLSRLTSESQPEWGAGSTMTYGYNSDSLLISRVRPAPNQTNPAVTVTTNYSYDALHRLTGRTYAGDPSGTPAAAFNYDESLVWSNNLSNTLGRLSSESSGATGQVFSYDSMGRVLSNWQCTLSSCSPPNPAPHLLSYGYDLAGDLTSAGNGAGVTFSYAYNTAPRLTTVTSSLVDAQHPGTLLSNAHYGPFGMVNDSLGNGINETIGYNARGMLQSYSSSPSVYSFTLTGLAGDGTITAGNDSVNGNWTYGYDELNRLLNSHKNGGAQTFSYDYDRYGNRWHQNAPQGGPAPQYSMDNATNRISGSGITYDAQGNELTDGLGSTYTYDAENRLVRVVNGGGTFNYTYDADGRRIANASTEFLYDLSGHAVTLYNASGGWAYGEIYAGGRHLATYSGATTNFLHTDWLGTRRVMTSVSGANSETCTGLPFGDSLSCTGTDWDFNHFTDDIHDSESNTDHTWFRQLSSTQGRWMRPDPFLGSIDLANPQSLNRYAYVLNDPMRMIDPFGLAEEDDVADDPCTDGLITCFEDPDAMPDLGGNSWSCGPDCIGVTTEAPGDDGNDPLDPCEAGLPGGCGEGPDRTYTGSNNNGGNTDPAAANSRPKQTASLAATPQSPNLVDTDCYGEPLSPAPTKGPGRKSLMCEMSFECTTDRAGVFIGGADYSEILQKCGVAYANTCPYLKVKGRIAVIPVFWGLFEAHVYAGGVIDQCSKAPIPMP